MSCLIRIGGIILTAKKIKEQNPNYMPLKFQLNMQIIADALDRELKKIEFYASGDACRLEGIRLYDPYKALNNQYVYYVLSRDVTKDFATYENTAFIVSGKTDPSYFSWNSPVIQVLDETSFLEIFNLVQDLFEVYKNWDWKLQRALYSSKPLDEMILASIEIFRNPMFIHDTNFFILADPKHAHGMLDFATDPRTGRKMVPMSLINDFMVDEVYLEGMRAHEAIMYPAEQRNYQILYFNLWNNGHYEGRILIDELQSPIQPGDFYALEYLGQLVEQCIKMKKLILMSMGNDIEQFFLDFLDGKIVEEHSVIHYLNFLSWNLYDHYLCLSIVSDQQEYNTVSALATLGQIEAQVSSGHAIMYGNSIVVIVNLSYSNSTAADILSKLAIILRDGLLKAGISSEITDFMLLPQAYKQATVALDFGRISRSTCWYYYFDDYMLDYMIECASKEIPIRLLCTDSLYELQKYDAENHTELYHTLLIYLRQNRNVLQTSKELFIHRSTLTYRLERIYKITGTDLNDPKERIKLLISYYMLEREV